MPSAFEARAARLISAGFAGKTVSPELAELVRRGLRSVMLFSRNVGEPAEVAELTAAIKRLTPEPLLVAVDRLSAAAEFLGDLRARESLADEAENRHFARCQ